VNLRRATFSATRWTTAATVFRAVLQVVQTMILARLLAPEDFGLMAMAGVATAVATLLADLGLGSALMHFPRPERRTLSTIYWLNLGMSICLSLAFALAAWPVALAYGQLGLVPVLWWLSLGFPLGALGQLFRVMAEKELQFRGLARLEIAASLLGFLAALAVAAYGGGVFAFVAGTLATAAAGSALAWLRLSAGIRPALEFSFAGAMPFLRFGLHRVGGNLWNTLSMQADVFIAGLHSSPAAIAFYAVPREQCLRISNTVVNPVVTRVGLPVMTRLQGDTEALRSVYLQTLRMTASLNFPLYALLVLFPREIVVLLLGEQWLDAATYLRLFALWGLIRSTGNPSGSLIFAVGMARRAHLWNLALLVAIVPPLWLAAVSGLPALAWTMFVMQAVIYVLAWRFLILPACGASFIEYNRQLAPPFLVTIMAAALTYFATQPLPATIRMPVGAMLLATLYLLFSWKFNAVWLRAMIELADPLVKILSPRK
jgi:O-antigen/teichoic acid export membrane protein